VLHEQLGIHLDRYGEISAANLMACARAFAEGRESYSDFIEIPREERARVKAYDLVLMRNFERERGSHKIPSHIGIMVNSAFMLHAQEKSLSCCVRVDQPDIWARVISFHRHKALTP